MTYGTIDVAIVRLQCLWVTWVALNIHNTPGISMFSITIPCEYINRLTYINTRKKYKKSSVLFTVHEGQGFIWDSTTFWILLGWLQCSTRTISSMIFWKTKPRTISYMIFLKSNPDIHSACTKPPIWPFSMQLSLWCTTEALPSVRLENYTLWPASRLQPCTCPQH